MKIGLMRKTAQHMPLALHLRISNSARTGYNMEIIDYCWMQTTVAG